MKVNSRCLLTATALLCTAGLSTAQDKPTPPPPAPPQGNPGQPGGPRPGLEEYFKKFDTNGDGKITKEEYLEVSKKEAEERFALMDANKDGSVDKAEAEEFAQKEMQRRGRRGGAGPEGGGTRQRPEGAEGQSSGQPPAGPGGAGGPRFGGGGGGGGMIAELARKVRETGGVTKEDFKKISEEEFDRLDANHDGKITPDEIAKLFQRFGGGMRRGGGEGADGGTRPRPEGAAPARPETEAPKP